MLRIQEIRRALIEAEEMDVGEEGEDDEQERAMLLQAIADAADTHGAIREEAEVAIRKAEGLLRRWTHAF